MLPALPPALLLITDRGYDADCFRGALQAQGLKLCSPGPSGCLAPIRLSKALYRIRCKIEVMFGCLKDWQRVATPYVRCAHTFFSAVTLATIVML